MSLTDVIIANKAGLIPDGTNLLVNSDFKNPVNTSGKTSWTLGATSTPILDTWYGARGTFELSSDGISVVWDGVNNVTGFIQNLFPLSSNLFGKIVTASCEIDGIVYSRTMTVPETVNAGIYSDAFENGLFFGVAYTATKFYFTILNGTTTPFTIAWAKLEIGKQATPFVPQNPEIEKLKCGQYLPLTGGTLTNDFSWKGGYGRISGSANEIQLESRTVIGDTNNRRLLNLRNSNAYTLQNALAIIDVVDGTVKSYPVLHAANSQKVTITADKNTPPSTMEGLWAY